MAARFLLLDLSPRGMTARMTTYGPVRTTPGKPVELAWEDLTDSTAFQDRLQAALAAVAGHIDLAGCRDAVVLLDAASVWFRHISLPFTQKSRIDPVLPFELAPSLPVEACISDYLRHDIRFVPDQQSLLTASVPAELVDHLAGCLKAYRIQPRIITPKGYAMAALFLDKTKPGGRDLVFVYAEDPEVTLTVIAGGKPVMVRTPAVPGLTGERIADQIYRTVMGFRQRTGRETRFDICLAASSQKMRETLVQEIRAGLKPCDILETPSIEPVDPDPLISAIMPGRPSETHLNFCRGRYDAGTIVGKFKREFLTALTLLLVVFLLAVFSQYRDISVLEAQISQVRSRAAGIYQDTFPDKTAPPGISPQMLMQAQVKHALEQKGGRAGIVEMAAEPAVPAVEILYALSMEIPATMDARLTRLVFGGGQLTIAGTTDSFNTVDRLKTALEKSTRFKTVTINSAETAKTGGRILFQFRITL